MTLYQNEIERELYTTPSIMTEKLIPKPLKDVLFRDNISQGKIFQVLIVKELFNSPF